MTKKNETSTTDKAMQYEPLLAAVLSDKIYPLTIISDRYSGAYSGARYLAFNTDSYDMPDEVGGGDMEEDDFWNISETYKEYKIGKEITADTLVISTVLAIVSISVLLMIL